MKTANEVAAPAWTAAPTTIDATTIPRWSDDDLGTAVELSFLAGYRTAIRLAAARVAELDALWTPVDRPTHEEQVAARVAEAERCADALHRAAGTRPFAGRGTQ